MWDLLLERKLHFLIAIFLTFLSSVAALPVAYSMRYLFDAALNGDFCYVWIFLVGVCLYGTFLFLFDWFFSKFILYAKTKMEVCLLGEYIDSYLDYDYQSRSVLGSNEAMRRAGTVKSIVSAFFDNYVGVFSCVAVLLLLLVYFAIESKVLLIANLFFIVLYFGLYRYTSRRNRKSWEEIAKIAQCSRRLSFSFYDQIDTLKIFGGNNYVRKILLGNSSRLFRIVNENIAFNRVYSSFCSMFAELFRYALFGVCILLVMEKHIGIGSAVSNFVLVGYLMVPVSGILSNSAAVAELSVNLERLNEVVKTKKPARLGMESEIGDKIEFDNVSFGYNGRLLFDGLQCEFLSGALNIVSGSNGCGKTTLLRLLMGDLKPQAGRIMIGEHALCELSLPVFRQQIAYVSQGVGTIPGSLGENISLGNQFDEEFLLGVIAKVGLKDLLDSLDNGIHTHIGEGGVGLSGGQNKKLTLARMLCHERKVIVLDEVEASLDESGKLIVLEFVNSCLFEGKIVVVVTHDVKWWEESCSRAVRFVGPLF